eukprot:211598-Rhodomonas_salina.4
MPILSLATDTRVSQLFLQLMGPTFADITVPSTGEGAETSRQRPATRNGALSLAGFNRSCTACEAVRARRLRTGSETGSRRTCSSIRSRRSVRRSAKSAARGAISHVPRPVVDLWGAPRTASRADRTSLSIRGSEIGMAVTTGASAYVSASGTAAASAMCNDERLAPAAGESVRSTTGSSK